MENISNASNNTEAMCVADGNPEEVIEVTEETGREIEAFPKQIANDIVKILQNSGIPQSFYAKEILNRSQGTFSDYLTKAPDIMSKTHVRANWLRLEELLKSREEQEELLSKFKRGSCIMLYYYLLLKNFKVLY